MERARSGRWIYTIGLVSILLSLGIQRVAAKVDNRACVSCHEKIHPNLVVSWRESPMARHGVTCIDCNGSHHKSAEDAVRVSLMVGRLCERCHPNEMAQFKSGKHGHVWTSVYRFTKVFELPPEMIDAEEGCGGCHAIGREDGQCDSCHSGKAGCKAHLSRPLGPL